MSRDPHTRRGWPSLVLGALGALLAVIIFPMLAIRVLAVGADVVTSESIGALPGEPIEAVVVPGARVFISGRPSGALLSRIELAEEIAAGSTNITVFASGGPGEDEVIAEYLPNFDVTLDPMGFSTIDTCRNARNSGLTRVAVVTQPRHRVRTAALCDAVGLDTVVVTTPQPRERLSRLPMRFGRERAAEYLAIVNITLERVGL